MWNEIFTVIERLGPWWTDQEKPTADALRRIEESTPREDIYTRRFEVLCYPGVSSFPKEGVQWQ
jgi:hypothetical protein